MPIGAKRGRLPQEAGAFGRHPNGGQHDPDRSSQDDDDISLVVETIATKVIAMLREKIEMLEDLVKSLSTDQ